MKTPELDADWHIHLHEALDRYFDQSELKDLCFDLSVPYEDLPGEAKDDKIRELIQYLARRGRLADLIDYCGKKRDKVGVDWDLIRASALAKPFVLPGEPGKPRPLPGGMSKWVKVGGLIALVVLAAVLAVQVLPGILRPIATPAPTQPTSQPVPAPTPTPTLLPTVPPTLAPTMTPTLTPCPQGLPDLGCPTSSERAIAVARQPFQRGRMIWVGGGSGLSAWEKVVVVLSGAWPEAWWQRFPDTWQEGQLESDPDLVPPEGLYQPVRGFGAVWRDQLGGALAPIGWATAPEKGVDGGGRIQLYEGGVALRLADEVLLLADDGSWRVEK